MDLARYNSNLAQNLVIWLLGFCVGAYVLKGKGSAQIAGVLDSLHKVVIAWKTPKEINLKDKK